MLKPIRWKNFPRDFFVIQIGFFLYGLSIALAIRANLGTGTWAVLDVALSKITGLTPGTMTVIVGFVVLVSALLMREQIGWGTLGNILSIGPWLDLTLYFIPSVENNWPFQLLMLLTGTLLQGIATAIYIGVNAGAGPRDSLMLAITRTTGIEHYPHIHYRQLRRVYIQDLRAITCFPVLDVQSGKTGMTKYETG